MSVQERFLTDNEMLIEPPEYCNLKVGDMVTFTNDEGVSFENKIVIGFAKPEHQLHGRFVHISGDSPWFPVKRESLTFPIGKPAETFVVNYPNGKTIQFSIIKELWMSKGS